MRIGTYSPEISGDTIDEVFSKAHAYGFQDMQYDFSSSHGDTVPREFYPDELQEIREAMEKYDIRITAINGTFNMIDPDKARKEDHKRRFENVAKACKALDCGIITLCTGSRHPVSGWRWHKDTALPDAWDEMIETTKDLLHVAEAYDVVLGVETEASNVVCTIDRTRRYLDEMNSPYLKVIMDCANLFPQGTAFAANVQPTIQKAFDVLQDDIILAHGKDIREDTKINFCGAGQGIVDFDFYFDLLRKINYKGGLIVHGLHGVRDFGIAVPFIHEKMERAGI